MYVSRFPNAPDVEHSLPVVLSEIFCNYHIFPEKPQISRGENVKIQLEKSLLRIVEIFSILFTGSSAKGGM